MFSNDLVLSEAYSGIWKEFHYQSSLFPQITIKVLIIKVNLIKDMCYVPFCFYLKIS